MAAKVTTSETGEALVLSVPQPAALCAALSAGETERDACLLVVGEYPDRKLTVREADLDDIVAAFAADTVPIKIEHVDSPLDPLGLVKRIWRDGGQLLGRIAFDADAAPFLQKRGVKKLSVGLDRDLSSRKLALAEVSLVLKPRIAAAALLHETDDSAGAEERVAQLEAQLAARDLDMTLATLKAAGKITPRLEPAARVLLAQTGGPAITLSDGRPASVAEAFLSFLSGLPPLVSFGETARARLGGGPAGAAASDMDDDLPAMTEDQKTFLRRMGADPEKVRAQMKRDRADAAATTAQ